jgi:hypothetical protein
VVRVFDDEAPIPWNAPRAVKASELIPFGGKQSSTKWDARRVQALKRHVCTAQFKHAFTLGAERALQ